MGAELSTLGMASRWTGVGELFYPYLAAEETVGPGPLERIAARRQALAATGDARAAAAIARLSAAAEATVAVAENRTAKAGSTADAGVESAVLSESGGGVQTLTTGGACDFWYLYDANGNVGQLLRYDAAVGTVNLAAAYEYDPYGNTLAARDVDGSGIATANKYRFSTKRLVDYIMPGQGGAVGTNGLYYYGYRFYSPGLGRWISRDPIGERGGINLSAAFGGRPIDRFDKHGLLTNCDARRGSTDPGDLGPCSCEECVDECLQESHGLLDRTMCTRHCSAECPPESPDPVLLDTWPDVDLCERGGYMTEVIGWKCVGLAFDPNDMDMAVDIRSADPTPWPDDPVGEGLTEFYLELSSHASGTYCGYRLWLKVQVYECTGWTGPWSLFPSLSDHWAKDGDPWYIRTPAGDPIGGESVGIFFDLGSCRDYGRSVYGGDGE